MPFSFGKSQKSPPEIVKNVKKNMAGMEKLDAIDSKKCEKISEEDSKNLSLKEVLCGTGGKEPQTEATRQQLTLRGRRISYICSATSYDVKLVLKCPR